MSLTHLQVAGLDLNLKLVFYESNEVTQAKIHEKYLIVVLDDDNCQILRTFYFLYYYCTDYCRANFQRSAEFLVFRALS